MNYLITAIIFILIFSVLVLVHELGHFVMAKRAGIRVEEFGFGLPPRIWGKKKGETIYSINWIPFGGFVRMLGEDATDEGMLRKKRSFIAQPMRARVKVIVAGVVMNFLLAWVLLVAGFTFGMQPLLGPDDVLTAVDEGVIELEVGAKIRSIGEGSMAEDTGMMAGDTLFSINGQFVDVFMIEEMLIGDPRGEYKVARAGEIYTYEITSYPKGSRGQGFQGLEFNDYAAFPRVKIFDLDASGDSYKAGLRKGDMILSLNGKQVFSVNEFEELARMDRVREYEVYRDGMVETIIVENDVSRNVIVSHVLPDTPARKVGLQAEDVILSVNGKNVMNSNELVSFVEARPGENLAFIIWRNGEHILYEITPNDSGKIGVMLSELKNYDNISEMVLYDADVLSSLLSIRDIEYPFHVSLYKAFQEEMKLAKFTVVMFGDFVKKLISTGEVADTVAGPVGIYQLTGVFVQEGFVSLLRFVAILSLSLAVINILPIPALDGGRLLFILVELIIGRRVNQRWEAYIHALGYGLILLLILVVTYSDIVRLLGF